MKEMAIDLRRNATKTKEACYALDEIFLKGGISALSVSEGPNQDEPYDALIAMLGTTMLSTKQFNELWIPSAEKYIRYAQEHKKTNLCVCRRKLGTFCWTIVNRVDTKSEIKMNSYASKAASMLAALEGI
jgi:hypothetical protein